MQSLIFIPLFTVDEAGKFPPSYTPSFNNLWCISLPIMLGFINLNNSMDSRTLSESLEGFLLPPRLRRKYAKACGGHCRAFFGANLSEQLLHWFTHLDIYLKHTRELARVPEGSLQTKTLNPVNIVRRDQNNLVSSIVK